MRVNVYWRVWYVTGGIGRLKVSLEDDMRFGKMIEGLERGPLVFQYYYKRANDSTRLIQ